jgi:hypothetical protein
MDRDTFLPDRWPWVTLKNIWKKLHLPILSNEELLPQPNTVLFPIPKAIAFARQFVCPLDSKKAERCFLWACAFLD